jgi:hypothetical protein
MQVPNSHFGWERPSSNQQPQNLCGICLSTIDDDKEVFNLLCPHKCHTKCLYEYWKREIGSLSFPLKCIQSFCKKEPTQADVMALIKEADPSNADVLINKYLDFSLKWFVLQSRGVRHCQTPGCEYFYICEEEGKEEEGGCGLVADYKCPSCEKVFCGACQMPCHIGQSCEEYKKERGDVQIDNEFA